MTVPPQRVEKTFFVRASSLAKDVDLVMVWRHDVKMGGDEDKDNSSYVAWKVVRLVAHFDNLLRLKVTNQIGIAILQQLEEDHIQLVFPRVATKIFRGDIYKIIQNKRGSLTFEMNTEKAKEGTMCFINNTTSRLDVGIGFYSSENDMDITSVTQGIGVSQVQNVEMMQKLCAYVCEVGRYEDSQILPPQGNPLWSSNIFALPETFDLEVSGDPNGSFSLSTYIGVARRPSFQKK